MTSETEINQTLAEWMGWRKDYPAVDESENPIVAWRNPGGNGPFGDCYVPTYTRSLDACAEVVSKLGVNQQYDLATRLTQHAGNDNALKVVMLRALNPDTLSRALYAVIKETK